MNRSFIRVLMAGSITLLMLTIISLGWIMAHSIPLLTGGVNRLPQATAFIPKQAPAMVSLLVNPERLYGMRQASLPLNKRQSDRQEWQRWVNDLASKIGLNYQRDLRHWLGDEVTLAVTALDYDRNPNNGTQPGYLVAAKAKSIHSARETLQNLYGELENISLEEYKGAKIISHANKIKQPNIWAYSVVGNFVLFANSPQIIHEAINQAQAVDLNLEQLDRYQTATKEISQPRIATAYIDVSRTAAWLDKLGKVNQPSDDQTLTTWVSVSQNNLVAQTALTGFANTASSSQAYKALINNPELEQIFDSLLLKNNTYIDLTAKTSLSSNLPFYEVSRLALKGLFPHLKAIAIDRQPNQDNISRAKILFKLDP